MMCSVTSHSDNRGEVTTSMSALIKEDLVINEVIKISLSDRYSGLCSHTHNLVIVLVSNASMISSWYLVGDPGSLLTHDPE